MATAKENLEDFITCSVCLEKFEGRDPRLLPCGHAFCLACVQDIHKTATAKQDNKLKDDEFRCPQCTTISNIPGKSVTNYPKFFHATLMNEFFSQMNPKTCSYDEREVIVFCFTCTKAFCDQCLTGHNKNRRYKNHIHVEVTRDNIESLVCKVHDKMVEAFCTDCCKVVCAHCLISSHTDHNINDFVISNQSPDTTQRDIYKKQNVLKDNIQRLETMQREFNAHITDILDQITKHTEMLVTQIREQSKTLQAELARHQADTNRELENMKKRYRESDVMIKEARAQISQLTQPIPELPSVSLQNIEKLISDIQQQFPQISTSMKDTIRYQFTPETADVLFGYLSKIERSSQSVKTSQSKRIAKDNKKQAPQAIHHDTQALSRMPGVTDRLGPKQESSGPSRKAATPAPTAESISAQGLSCQLSGTFIHKETRLITKINGNVINSISWTPTGNVLVAAGSVKLKMYNTQGEELPAPCDLSGVEGRVRSVAVHQPQSTVAIVAGWDDNHLYITSLGGGRQARRVCKLPDGYLQLTFTAGGDVLMFGRSKLHKYNTEGTKLWGSNTKHQAEYITTTQDNKIIISGDNQLSVHDQDGRWLSSFPRDTATLCDPRGVCADASGHVFVADYDKQAVLMYTSNGTYVREVVRVEGRPVQLALYQDKYLAVGVKKGDIRLPNVLCVYNII